MASSDLFEGVKVGDKFVYQIGDHYSNQPKYYKTLVVEKITPKQVHMTDGNRYNKISGCEIGDSIHTYNLHRHNEKFDEHNKKLFCVKRIREMYKKISKLSDSELLQLDEKDLNFVVSESEKLLNIIIEKT